MNLELTPALELALERAQQLAGNESADAVEPRHLLRGLLAEEEGRPATLLTRAGVDWPRLQATWTGPSASAAASPKQLEQIMPHQAVRSILASAGVLARHHGDGGSITTEHALLALLTAEPTIREELAGLGFDFARLHHDIVGDTEAIALDEPLVLEDPIEVINTARILDASANRAREALRVLEDHTRFVLDDAFLSSQLKQLRHDFAHAVGLLPESTLLAARDTQHDVGTAISTDAEWQRSSLGDVLQANAKRLQEALRSLEEYGKTVNADFARLIEKIRYQSYTLERALLLGKQSRERLADAQLYVLVTASLCRASLVGTVREALLGGAQVIQLREKGLDDLTLLATARDVCQLVHSAGAIFIVNDRPDVARLSDADGVHLGQDDMAVRDARRLLGADALIGVSTHHLEQVQQAVLDGASYIGVGPTFPSQTKAFAGFAGLDFVRQACTATSLPAFAIGGIGLDNFDQVCAAGARRIAVSHAICAADDPRSVALRFRKIMG